jgi:membrane associated rhomboid family serine protease
MLLPLGDSPNPRSVPYMTYALLFANLAVFVLITVPLSAAAPAAGDPLLQQYVDAILHSRPQAGLRPHVEASVTAYELFVFEHGFRPAAPGLSALFSAMFLHAGLPHLLGNLLFLWIYGDNVEYRLGPLAFLGAYLGTGVAATLFHAVANFGSPLPLIGASGAISGVLGFYFRWFPRNHVRLFLMLPPLLFRTLYIPARIVLAMYLVVDNLLPFALDRGFGGGGVAHGAHIGGFVAGLAGAGMIDRRTLAALDSRRKRA